MERQKRAGKKEFLDMMIKKAYSKDSEPEPYIPRITTKKDKELKPYGGPSVNQEEIERLTERLKVNLADRGKKRLK